jgi:hypothetical protein
MVYKNMRTEMSFADNFPLELSGATGKLLIISGIVNGGSSGVLTRWRP